MTGSLQHLLYRHHGKSLLDVKEKRGSPWKGEMKGEGEAVIL